MTHKRFSNVWDALEDSQQDAANMRVRASVMIAIQKNVDRWRSSQADNAKRLGLTQPRLNDLLRGKIDKFSLDALVMIASAAGLKVTFKIGRAA
jgi:predicted XRE-type DNA-binding protein